MKAVLLAASEDIKMHPLTYTRPKAMLPLANKPILEHLLLQAKEAGIKEYLIVVGYNGEIIRDYFGNGERWGLSIEYISQRQQLGTANAVMRAKGRLGERFLVMNGDIVTRARDIKLLASSDNVTVLLTEVENPADLGVVELEEGVITHIQEKKQNPSSRIVSAGLYMLTEAIFPAIENSPVSPRGEYDLTDALQYLIDSGNQVQSRTTDFWFNPDYPWDLLKANTSFMSSFEIKNSAKIENNVTLKGNVTIGEQTQIDAGAYIEGPALIGDRCHIGTSTHIGSGSSIGNNCQISSFVEIERSILLNDTQISSHAYIGDSIIGQSCFLGAGTKTAALRFDAGNIKVSGIDTGLLRLGAILGDKVRTGVNVSIDAGTLIGNDSIIGLGAVPRGIILPNSRIL
jgi:UDP-N-acetylglucosamine diphosphorylase/glucosamine-1-phosphate N-acetyltransferase